MTAYAGDYYDLDEILSTEPRIYATFKVPGHRLTHLDPQHLPPTQQQPPTTQTTTLPQNTRLPLPFWLAETLAERNLVTLDIPRCYGVKLYHDLLADANHVNLYTKCKWWLRLGCELMKLIIDERLGLMLVRGYGERCWGIVGRGEGEGGWGGSGSGSGGGGGKEGVEGLCEVERDLWFVAWGCWKGLRKWRERGGEVIRAAPRVLGKRRLMAERVRGVEEGEVGRKRRRGLSGR